MGEYSNDSSKLHEEKTLSIDQAILKLLANDPTMSQSAIARALKVSPQYVSKRVAMPKLKAAIIDIHGTVAEVLAQAKQMAARRLKRLIQSDDESIALKATAYALRAELEGAALPPGSIRFVTVVNEVGVLETKQDTIDAELIGVRQSLPETAEKEP